MRRDLQSCLILLVIFSSVIVDPKSLQGFNKQVKCSSITTINRCLESINPSSRSSAFESHIREKQKLGAPVEDAPLLT